MATAQQIEEIVKLYVGYFNRAPDPEGLNYWVGRLDDGFPLDRIADSFSVQPESTGLYPFLDDRDFANITPFLQSVYQNLFNRTVPADDEGLNYWKGEIEGGKKVGSVILDIISGAVTSPDKDVVENKVAVGLDFYDKVNPLEDYEFDGDAMAAALGALDGVTNEASSVAAAVAENTAYLETLTATPPVILTVNADTPGASAPAVDTSGNGSANSYEGIVGAVAANNTTLNSSDNLAAGDGTDRLDLRVLDLGGFNRSISPTATGLEEFYVTSQDGSAIFTLDFAAISGETQVWAVGTSPFATFMPNNVDMGTVAGLDGYDGSYFINYKGDRSGTDDAFSAVFKGAGMPTSFAQFLTVTTAGATDQSFEIANITAMDDASHVFLPGSMTLRDLNVTGNALVVLQEAGTFSGLETVDGSGNSGGTDVSAWGAGASTFTFTGGSGMDRIAFQSGYINSANTILIDTGDGKDTLASNSWTLDPATVNGFSGLDVLENRGLTGTLDADDFTQIDEFLFAAQRNAGRTDIDDIESDDRFVIAEDQRGQDEVLQFEGAVIGTDLTLDLTHMEGSDGTTVESTAAAGSDAAIGFSGNIDEVNLVSTGETMNANEILTQDLGGFTYFAFRNDDGVSDFTLTGDRDLTITAREGLNLNASSDLRGFSEAVNFDGSGFSGMLRIAGSAFDDALVGGSGNDILYGLGGEDMLTGNGGMDQFRFSNWFFDDDTITDFENGTDMIGLNAVNFANTTATAAGATLAAADYIENVSSIANLSSAEDDTVVELQSGASGNQIANSTSGATVDAFVLVFNTTTSKGELWYDSDWASAAGRFHVATFDDVEDQAGVIGFSNTDFAEYIF